MGSPRTSFLLPVRDGEQTLQAAIHSICAQSEPDFELIVVNDNSTDHSRDIAHAVTDPRIRVVDNPGCGLVDALNYGLSLAQGTYIARMDADDWAAPERLALQLPYFDNPNLGVVDGQVRFTNASGRVAKGMALYGDWVNSIITPADFDRELLIESPVVHPAATFRRDVVLQIGGYRDGKFPEDYDLWLRLHALGFQLAKVPQQLVTMRDHDRRLTRTDPRYNRAGFRAVRQRWLEATQLRSARRIALFGAGKECGPWLRWLQTAGHEVCAIVDVAPSRIGRSKHGVPIIALASLTSFDVDLGLFLVGTRGARQHLRESLAPLKPTWVEGRDWWAVR